ncbi:MAG: hypothetical protein QMD85_05460 [Candidatus Aenigmarchaeota archaeon]|nr:hypothetical protein [Candidatus Aenigmarchaeota archaeon]
MFRVYGIAGLTLVISAYIINFLVLDFATTALFTVGFWLFFDAIDYQMNKTSILHKIMKRHWMLLWLLLAGIFIGYTFEFFGRELAGLWIITDNPNYFELFPGILFGYGVPILMYYSFYRVILSLIGRRNFGIKLAGRKSEKGIMGNVSIAGAIFTIIPLLLFPALGALDPVMRGFMFGFTLLGMWFLLEHIEYRRHEKTLLMDILEGRWVQPLALAAGAVITGLLWEASNALNPSWTYTNLPFADVQIAGVPLAVLIGWIPLYIVYLSFYRAVFRGDRIWETKVRKGHIRGKL